MIWFCIFRFTKTRYQIIAGFLTVVLTVAAEAHHSIQKVTFLRIFSLIRCCTSDTFPSLEARLSLVSNACQQLLDLGDGLSGVETLGAGHDGVASVDGEGVPQLVQPGSLLLIPGINDPAVCLHQDCRSQVLVTIPPVGRTGGGAAGTKDALIEAVKLGPVINGLQVLLGHCTL